jgi:hypothetical protein
MASKPLLLALLVGTPLALGAFWYWNQEPSEASRRGVHLPEPVAPATEEVVAVAPVELVPVPVVRTPEGEARSTVLWPLKLELDLIEAQFLPKEDGLPPVGSGATARLSGEIWGTDDLPAQAEVRFVAGANAGRVLRTDIGGRFGAADLYPGLSIVEVHGLGTLGSRREVRLRRGKQTLLNIGYGRPGAIFGLVQDQRGEPIAGAQVWVDGTRVVSDDAGGIYLSSVAAGEVLVEVEKEGFARYQENFSVAGGAVTPKERFTLTLAPECTLRLAIDGNVGGPGPVQVYLLSERSGWSSAATLHNQSFPWHRVNPVEITPGRPVTITGLPAGVVRAHAFRTGARAPVKVLNLSQSVTDAVISLEPAPALHGRVLKDGAPVAGATVRCEAPDRVRATLGYFRADTYFLETAVLPNLPPGIEEVTTDSAGRFVVSAWDEVFPMRYLEARAAGGGWAGRFVEPSDEEIVLELEEMNLGDSLLRFEFPGRHQGLPVELWVGGSPREVTTLPSNRDFEIEGLLEGRWSLKVSWHSRPVQEDPDLRLEGVKTVTVALPPECIEGQDEEAWTRAGRVFPGAPGGQER